jgi:FMN reductase
LKILVLAGSNVGDKTVIASSAVYSVLKEKYGDSHELSFIDLQEKEMVFGDGRNYLDYSGDTGEVAQAVMEADVIIFGSPIFHASIPGSLKNIFDLLPQDALQYKTVGMIVTAGSSKHFLIPEQQLKPILGYMKANIVPNYVFVLDTDYHQDKIINDDVLFRIDKLVEDTMVLAQSYKQIWDKQEESYGF